MQACKNKYEIFKVRVVFVKIFRITIEKLNNSCIAYFFFFLFNGKTKVTEQNQNYHLLYRYAIEIK